MRNKIIQIIFVYFSILMSFISCNSKTKKSENLNHNKEGAYIKTDKHQKTEENYNVFIYNETDKDISSRIGVIIEPRSHYIFKLVDTDSIILNNKIKFFLGETDGLEVKDELNQVSGLGGTYLKTYMVPDFVDWAFTILVNGKGDK